MVRNSRRIRNIFVFSCLVVLMKFAAAQPAFACNVTYQMAHGGSGPSDVRTLFAEHFSQQIEERTDGEVCIEVYSASTLGDDYELVTLVTYGHIELAAVSMVVLPSANSALFRAPGLFPQRRTLNSFFSRVGLRLWDDISEYRLVPLCPLIGTIASQQTGNMTSYLVFTNMRFLDGLSDEVRTTINEATQDLCQSVNYEAGRGVARDELAARKSPGADDDLRPETLGYRELMELYQDRQIERGSVQEEAWAAALNAREECEAQAPAGPGDPSCCEDDPECFPVSPM